MSIINDLKSLDYSVKNGDWYQAGHDLGDIVNCLIFGNKAIEPLFEDLLDEFDDFVIPFDISDENAAIDNAKEFLRGWLIGVFNYDVVGNVADCMGLVNRFKS